MSETSQMSEPLILHTDKKIGPWQLTEFLFQANQYRNFEPLRPFKSYLKEAKSFLETAGIEEAIHLIEVAAKITEHPFGFKFLEKLYAKNFPSPNGRR